MKHPLRWLTADETVFEYEKSQPDSGMSHTRRIAVPRWFLIGILAAVIYAVLR